MINFYLIKSNDATYFENSKTSFYATTPNNTELIVIEELQTREKTLNYIFELNNDRDMVCFADDIILTPGWFEIVKENLSGVTSLGFSMKHPDTDKPLNFGFDLVSEQGDIKTLARGSWVEGVNASKGINECASYTGCFFSLTKECFNLVRKVPLEGQNRLGELLYHVLLAREGGKILVSQHLIGHYSVSTKTSTKEFMNSQSYSDEKIVWDVAKKKFDLGDAVTVNIEVSFSDLPFNFPREIVLWGAGSISKKLIKQYGLDVRFFVSGLIEEDGREFQRKKIYFYKSLKVKRIKNLLITIENLEVSVLGLIKKHLNVKNVFYTKVEYLEGCRQYSIIKF
jgi:hypothetical protein